jgi:hypothetical protein
VGHRLELIEFMGQIFFQNVSLWKKHGASSPPALLVALFRVSQVSRGVGTRHATGVRHAVGTEFRRLSPVELIEEGWRRRQTTKGDGLPHQSEQLASGW